MAQQQHYRMSDGSSTTSSHILLTPSETIATPSATLLDVSHQGREDLGASNSLLSEQGVSDDALPMDLDNNHMPDTTLSFQQQYMDERPYHHVGHRNGWTANEIEYTGIQYAGGSKALRYSDSSNTILARPNLTAKLTSRCRFTSTELWSPVSFG